MIRAALVAALAFLFVPLPPARSAPEPPTVLAPAGILVDAATGEVLWQREADTPRPIASTTKMMTVLLALESGGLDEVVTIAPGAVGVPECSLNLRPGETMTLRDLLYGVMLRSANDAAVATAIHVGGDVDAFVVRMNARAEELGCRHTHFVNPSGLHDPDHYSTPRDLSLIARAALQRPEFRSMARAPVYTMERSKNRYDRALRSRFGRFLRDYDGADGVKTGYTRQAGHCFVASATRGSFQMVAVLLHSPNVRAETAALLDWGFRHYRSGVAVRPGVPLGVVSVSGGSKRFVNVAALSPVAVTVRKHDPPVRADLSGLVARAPIRTGHDLGSAPLVSGGRAVGRVEVVATESVGYSRPRQLARLTAGGSFFALVSLVLGTAAKDHRRRRSRVAPRRGGTHPRGACAREWRNGAPGPPSGPLA